ncbi:hypothetical protein, partial [Burkholderia stagnalis]|uniref:hypothetical protein n=1 Tax=Burkholderia stagnalis TaxID=1503054 RepID=UPI001E418798
MTGKIGQNVRYYNSGREKSETDAVLMQAQTTDKQKCPHKAGIYCFGGADGTRLHPAGRGCACRR